MPVFVATFGKVAMSQSDQEYLISRAAQERALAAEASDEIVQDIHRRLAREYEARARQGSAVDRNDNDLPGLTSVGDQSS
jgi:hypothetical protein